MSTSPDSSTPPAQSSLGRAAFLGLASGMLLGGVWLLFLGVRGLFMPPSCAQLSKNECEVLLETASHIGRVQTLCGGALVALAPCLYILLRPYLSPKPSQPKPAP
jgi:hypothetical protein